MEEFEAKLHRTLIEYLIDCELQETAALLIDASIIIDTGRDFSDPLIVIVDLPPSVYNFLIRNDKVRDTIKSAINVIGEGHFYHNGEPAVDYLINFRIKLIEVKEGWKDIVRNIILNYKDPNQAIISEKVMARKGGKPLVYNEMKFASQSEVRIAQQLEVSKVLFFPLPLAVRNDTGDNFRDHREIDFLVCNEGIWGILEVSFHPDRFEKDSEKDIWFKKSGILCIQHYTAEKCFNEPDKVVQEFLEILQKYKK